MAKKKLSMIAGGGTQLSSFKVVSVRSVMSSRDFVDGFNEARNGKPFDYERESSRDSWFYERGRQLALVYDGRLKEGRYLIDEAVSAYITARKSGVII